jgi:hypothetical protein
MRKVTKYEVSGVLDTKPTNLPDGLSVSEVEVEVRSETINITPIHGWDSRTVSEWNFSHDSPHGKVGFMWSGSGIFSESETRRLRDFLNEILGESQFRGRVLVDCVDDVWFEFTPNQWTQGNDRHNTNPNPYQRAKERLTEPDALTNQTLEYIIDCYGPVVFIENTWEG